MLELRQQVGGCEFRVGRFVGDDQHLARAGDHIDVHAAEELLFRLGDVDVARADDLIDARQRLGAVCERGDRLRAADGDHTADAGDFRRRRDCGRDASALGRGGDDDFLHPGHGGGDAVHQHRGGIRRRPAGDIHADAPKRADDAAEQSARLAQLVARAFLLFVIAADIGRGLLHRFVERRRRLRGQAVQLGRRQLERRKLDAVGLPRDGLHRRVAALGHAREDRSHAAADLGVAAPRAAFQQLVERSDVLICKNFHAFASSTRRRNSPISAFLSLMETALTMQRADTGRMSS